MMAIHRYYSLSWKCEFTKFTCCSSGDVFSGKSEDRFLGHSWRSVPDSTKKPGTNCATANTHVAAASRRLRYSTACNNDSKVSLFIYPKKDICNQMTSHFHLHIVSEKCSFSYFLSFFLLYFDHWCQDKVVVRVCHFQQLCSRRYNPVFICL